MPLTGLTREDKEIRKQSSGLMWGVVVDSDGSDTATPGSFLPFGRVAKSLYDRKAAQTKEKDEGGTEVVTGTETTAEFSYTVMQRNLVHMQLPTRFGIAGERIRFVKELTNSLLNGKAQYLVIGNAEIEPGLQVDGSDMFVKHKYTAFPVQVAVTVDLGAINDGSFGALLVATASLAIGDYEALVEFVPA